ncbi:thermosome subunit [Nitzschia inconspicua]|uniref:Thermosome subunit n=1 Tax=Nitzschia inconspicua TaxID=303405 RepID=A0A9K3KZT3_9STRA|nr:thermosome subunit [Nitzschia inconspicua]
MFQNLIGVFVTDEKSSQDIGGTTSSAVSSSIVTPPVGSSLARTPIHNNSNGNITLNNRSNGVSSSYETTAMGEGKQGEEKEDATIDEDALAGTMLVQFPTYGTRSQASSASIQWQEKTADWLLGGHNVPTPQQQLKQQQLEEQQRLLAEENLAANRATQSASNGQSVSFQEWSKDEQELWKTKRFHQEEKDANQQNPYKLKEHDVTYVKPVLEDPSRDLLAAYYYHTGVFPRLEPPQNAFSIPEVERKPFQQQQKQPSPFSKTRKEMVPPSSLDAASQVPVIHEDEDDDQPFINGANQNMTSPSKTSDRDVLASEVTGKRNSLTKSLSSPAVIEDVAWMPDQLCKTCYSCDAPFSFLRRRHHCRICGQVFCNSCSGYFVPAAPFQQNKNVPNTAATGVPSQQQQPSTSLPSMHNRKTLGVSTSIQPGNNNTILRTCKMCFEQVMAQQKKKELDAEEAAAADAAKKRKNEDAPLLPQYDQNSVGTPQPQVKTPTASHSSLRDQLISGDDGSVLQTLSKRRVQETPFAQRRLRSKEMKLEEEEKEETTKILQRMDDRSLTSGEDLSTMSPTRAKNQSSTSLASEDSKANAVKEGNRELGKTVANHLEQMAASLMETDAPLLWKEMMNQDGNADGSGGPTEMQSKWVDKLMSLATRCCATVDPNIKRGDLLDIRPYVKIKVIPGGKHSDCAYISGVVFRKTGTNKQMPREIIDPRIMLLSGGIEFTRTENRITSLDTLLEQEDKYIEILVGKILKLKPDVLVVGKAVCRRAQELLFQNRVQLLQHVKPSLLTRISRLTGAAIISSTDHIMNQFGPDSLGKCFRFRFVVARMNEVWVDDKEEEDEQGRQNIKSLLNDSKLTNHRRQAALAANMLGEDILDGSEAIKSGLSKRGVTQMYAMIEGCPKHLGCTVILRGANKAALKQVKNVFRFLVSVAYNMKLEVSYLKERCARLRPDYKVEKKNLFSSSLCVDYGQPPSNRKIRPWNGGTNNEGMQRSISGQITAFDHQSILITSVWMTEKTQCCPAEVKGICYYSMQDVSLGQFLRDSCFNLSLKCQNPSCKKSVLDHSLSFVHNDGLINITVDHMDDALPPAPSETKKATSGAKQSDDDSEEHEDTPIATWTYCKQCSKVVTPLVWISENTWKYSFGKFLESFFYNRDTIMNSPQSTCRCQLQKSATLFFGCGRLAARLTYERIRPFGVFVRKSLPIDIPFHRAKALNELEKISMSSSLLFVKFDKHIEKVAREARSISGGSKNENLQTVLSELNRISNEVDHAAKTLQEKIASVSDKCINGSGGSVNIDALFQFPWFARRFLFMLTSAWNEKLNAAGQAIVAMKRLSSQRGEILGPNAIVGDQNTEELAEGMRRLRQLHEVYSRYNLTDIHTVLPTIVNAEQRAEPDYDDDFEDPDGAIDFAGEVDADVLASRRRLYNTNAVPHTVDLSRSGAKALAKREDHESGSMKQTPGATVKSAITRFFQRGGRERDPYIVDLGIFHEGRPRLEPGINGIVVPVMDEQLSTVIAYSLSSKEYSAQFQNFSKLEGLQYETATNANTAGDQQNTGTATSSASGISTKQGIEMRMLMRHKSHIKHTFRDFDEKGQNLCKFVCTTYWATQFHAVREAFLSQNMGSKDSSAEGAPSTLEVERAYVLSLSSAYDWAASGGKSGASFARTQDDRFVIKCISRTELQMFLDCAPAYFEYLSKAFFHGLPTVLCKIVGVYQIGYHNRVTGKRSMEQVAVMQNIFYNKNITKTFDLKGSLRGRFAAQINRNYEDHSGSQQDISYNGGLRESQRKRMSDAGLDGEGDDGPSDRDDGTSGRVANRGDKKKGAGTLLDGDFLEFTMGRPMPMHDRAKAVFHMSILNDTLFLSIINVLDYSILVGIDEEKMELVVGIIDFMRQYDILKQMERVGKSLPMVVGSEAPTIIQPPLYKARFTNAMERYFMTVPSKWTSI